MARRYYRGGTGPHSLEGREALRERWLKKGEQLRAIDAQPEKPHGLKGRRPANLDREDATATRRVDVPQSATRVAIVPTVLSCRHEGAPLE